MTISVTLTDQPVGVTVSADAGAVSVSAATVTAVQVGIGDTAIPTTHGGTHAANGSDPVVISATQVIGTLDEARLPASVVKSDYYGGVSIIGALGISPPDWDGLRVGYNQGDNITFTVNGNGDVYAAVISCIGISVNGTAVCLTNDSRLSNARLPTAHTHAASDITSGTIATARLASGTASASTYLRGDQTWATVSSYTLPAATTSALGGVVVGTGLSVSSGTVSANVVSVAGRTGTVTLAHSDVGNSPATLTQFTASQNNLSLGTGGIVRISSNAAVNITGFAATTGGDARMLSNVGSFAITLKHSDASSTAANRILCVGNADVVIAAGGSAVVYYDATDSRWRVG